MRKLLIPACFILLLCGSAQTQESAALVDTTSRNRGNTTWDPYMKDPEIIHAPKISTPEHIRLVHSCDTVLVRLSVDTMGIVVSDTVLKSTNPKLDSAAQAFGMQYRFTSAVIGTSKVKVWVIIPMRFKP